MSELVTRVKKINRIYSLDIALFLFAFLLITGQYIVGGYTSLADCVSDIKLRNSVLILFYYSVSRLLFHYYKGTAYLISLSILLLITLKESYMGIIQLYHGAEYPVGSMSNTNLWVFSNHFMQRIGSNCTKRMQSMVQDSFFIVDRLDHCISWFHKKPFGFVGTNYSGLLLFLFESKILGVCQETYYYNSCCSGFPVRDSLLRKETVCRRTVLYGKDCI